MAIDRSITITGHGIQGTPVTLTNESEFVLDVAVADSVTDGLHAMVLDVTQVKSIIITSDQAVTLEFNNSTTGVPTIVLVANMPYVWTTNSYDTLILTADVTALYITNASGSVANVKIRALIDPTV